ncbi:hypothetical protein C8Q79DRAFT_34627 [Trametes meyenii]|nr:hypothetical protein C8Q79DRAFT_34627 [Trametes meyenii]
MGPWETKPGLGACAAVLMTSWPPRLSAILFVLKWYHFLSGSRWQCSVLKRQTSCSPSQSASKLTETWTQSLEGPWASILS